MKIGIIGSGISATSYISAICDELEKINENHPSLKVEIFEKSSIMGSGMPYDKNIAEPWHLMNSHNSSPSSPDIKFSDDDVIERRMSFVKWLSDEKNIKKLEKEFKDIFFKRFQKSYKIRFNKDFNGENILENNDDSLTYSTQEAEMIRYHQAKFKNYKEKTFSELKKINGFAPRIVYGFFLKALFDYQCERLARIIGRENLVLRNSCEIVDIKDAQNPEIKDNAGNVYSGFDNIFAAIGVYVDNQSKENKKYLQDIWGKEKVEEYVLREVNRAIFQGKNEAKIAIKGSSLSAVDLLRTIYDGMADENGKIKGVKIKTDVVSRKGSFQKVKKNFRWDTNQYPKYFPRAVQKVAEQYGRLGLSNYDYDDAIKDSKANSRVMYSNMINDFKKVFDSICAKNPNGEIYMWQILKLFCDIAYQTYNAESLHHEALKLNSSNKDLEVFAKKLESKSNYYKELSDKVLEAKGNYKEIIKYINLENDDVFAALKEEVEDISQGDNIDGDYIFENLYTVFSGMIGNCGATSKLPIQERIVRNSLFRSFFGQVEAAMPIDSARFLIKLHDQELLESVAVGYGSSFDHKKACFAKSDGTLYRYNMVLDSSGLAIKNKNNTNPLINSLLEQGILESAAPIEINKPKTQIIEELKQQFPEKYVDLVSINIGENTQENCEFYSHGVSWGKSFEKGSVTAQRSGESIFSAINAGKSAGAKLAAKITAKAKTEILTRDIAKNLTGRDIRVTQV